MTPFDATGAFCPVAEGSELRRLAVRGAGATVSASALGLVLQVVGTVVLARLLTPADFGVVTMVTTFSLLLSSFGVTGFTEAVIQSEEMDRHTASNLFWINLGSGLVLAIGFATCGSLLAKFYRNPLVANVAIAVSVGTFIQAASVIHLALLKRAMRFGADSANQVVARAVYLVVPILLALRGWGYWALVAGLIAFALSTTLGAWWLCRWLPSLPQRTGRTVTLLRFAAHVYGRFSFRYSTQNLDNLLVGWRFNAAALGFYKKAYDLFALSATQLTAPLHDLALAALSRLKSDPARFRRTLVSSLGIIALVGLAMGADLTLAGNDVIRLVLGPQWGPAGTIFRLFGPGIGIMLLYSAIGWIHLSVGRPDRWLRWTLFEFAFTALLFVLGLRWGPAGVAAAWTASYWLLIIPGFWYAGKPIQLPVSAILGAVWKYVLASLLAGAASVAIARYTPLFAPASSALEALARIVSISTIFLTLYLGAVVMLHRGFDPLLQAAALLREMVSRRDKARLEKAVAMAGDNGAGPALPLVPGGHSIRSEPTARANAPNLWTKAYRRVELVAVQSLHKQPLQVSPSAPIVSFTFDDFPRSALLEGGVILKRFGVAGTYYVSLGLMGKQAPPGEMFLAEDLPAAVEQGHELGCHTFGHCHSWNTPPDQYERAILENQQALTDMVPGASFQTFSYPFSAPRPAIKKIAGRHFQCCRGGGMKTGHLLFRHAAGGQTFNSGITDLNYLCAYFLEQSRDNPEAVRSLIAQNAQARGWLIFATHDVCTGPSSFGCTPDFFEQVVQWSLDSGAQILPVVQALGLLRALRPPAVDDPSRPAFESGVQPGITVQ